MRGQRRGEARMLGASSVEVRAEGDHDRGRARLVQVDQGIEEATSGRFVRTERERLLELVDDEERRTTSPSRTSQLRLRVRARRHELPARTRARRNAGMTPALTSDDFPRCRTHPPTAMDPRLSGPVVPNHARPRVCPTPKKRCSRPKTDHHISTGFPGAGVGRAARDGQPGGREHPRPGHQSQRPPRSARRRPTSGGRLIAVRDGNPLVHHDLSRSGQPTPHELRGGGPRVLPDRCRLAAPPLPVTTATRAPGDRLAEGAALASTPSCADANADVSGPSSPGGTRSGPGAPVRPRPPESSEVWQAESS